MKTWSPAPSPARWSGLLLLGILLVGAGALAWAAWTELATGYNLPVFFYASAALLLGGGAALLAYRLVGVWSLAYTLDRNALTIRWAGLRQVIPLARLREAAAVADLAPPQQPPQPRGLRLPGLWVGRAAYADGTPLLAYATAPPVAQVVLRTPSVAYTISPAQPQAFLAELAQAQALGPTTTVGQGTEGGGLAAHPLLNDRLAWGLLGVGLLLNLLLFGYLALLYGGLPDLLALHWDIQGQPDRIGSPDEVLRLPVIAAGLGLVDALIAIIVHPRDRLGALILYAGAAVVQVVFWAAVLTIVLRAGG